MKRLVLLLILFTVSVLGGQAQTPLGYAGTWLLDEKASFSRDVDKRAFDNYVLEILKDDETFQ